ncbi:uncharacterized protein F5891DRAFT_563029 [Suillus fuscotomentosus]|uniref:Wax synthase domain-containing protein n=1 Tax=Suillus fuscotomentosus TaxID=1912939 RepID=A0AAD4HHT0_9AGAM|nr:uncharacterized protein F5891DRAFT_563029 [Suillus fuscotomentosus]KAG1896997.1 hypothetical protein F5891DRAFT_563029 [Suillus fuscotomentosus]
MRLLVLFCIFLSLVGVIQAAPTTNTTNTTTNDSVKAPSFTTRTLWTIISSSVLTLFACIYSAIHPNIPSPKNSSWHHILWRQLTIMTMALIAPELIVTWAMRQWFSAHQVTKQFGKLGYPSIRPESEEEDSVEAPATGNWFIRFICRSPFIRLFLLLVKGILSVPVSLWRSVCALARWVVRRIQSEQSNSDSEDPMWTQTHSFFVLMGGFMLYVDGKPYLTLRPDYILTLIRDKCIDAPTLTAKQIYDKSKGNAISKGLVMLQVAWFVMQLITRAVYHLETTQLEVGTLAFAVLNFLTYAVWWGKPLNVQCPYPVYWKSESRPEDHIDVSDPDEFSRLWYLPRLSSPIMELIGWTDIPISRKLQVPTFDGSVDLQASDRAVVQRAALLMAIIFGGIHCMAWFLTFPTYEEQVLWRSSAVAITCIPWLCLSVYLDSRHSARRLPHSLHQLVWGVYVLICVAFAILYITARVILLVLMFTTLRDIPPDAYKAVSWTSLVPHL